MELSVCLCKSVINIWQIIIVLKIISNSFKNRFLLPLFGEHEQTPSYIRTFSHFLLKMTKNGPTFAIFAANDPKR